jgi:hypothetical protein
MQNGKGDRNRSCTPAFREGWERIFNRCSVHPRYEGEGKPRGDCKVCWQIYDRRRKV